MALNKAKFEICGANYVISSPDTEEYVLGLAEKLDEDMQAVLSASSNASVTAAAVLTALSYLDEIEKSKGSADNMRIQVKEYFEETAKARQEADSAKKEANQLRFECERLRKEIGYMRNNQNNVNK